MRTLMIGFDGTSLPEHVGSWIDQGLGGVILFRRNIESLEQLIALNGEILGRQRALMLGVDEEGGRVRRLRRDDAHRDGPQGAARAHADRRRRGGRASRG